MPSAFPHRRALRRSLVILSFTGLVFTTFALPQSVAAQGEQGNVCVRDYQTGAVCTANDVRIEALNVVSVVETCVEGTPGETEVIFEALVSADGSPDRYDIGLFLALDGGSARDGDSCYHDFLSPPLTATPTYGDTNMDGIPDIDNGPWWNGDTDGDSCGDIESNTQVLTTLPSLRFACIDNNGDGSADVSVCTSWDNNTTSACNSVVDATPGTNSKCSCDEVELGIAPAPELTIEKTPEDQQVMLGGTATWDFTVTSRTTITNVSVSDPDCDAPPLFTGGDDGDMVLEVGETWTYTCSKSAVTMDFTNTVTVTGDAPNPADGGMTTVMVSDTDSADTTVAIAALTLTKTGTLNDGGDGVDAGDTISYTFDVENTGNLALTNIAVTDPLSGLSAITCPGGNPIPALAPAATVQCTASYTVTQADVDAGQVDNTATADSDQTEPVEDSETVALAQTPAMSLTKTGTLNDGGDGQADAGDTISYTFDVENTGNVTLTNVAVTDPLSGLSAISCPGGNPIPSVAPGATVQCTASYTVTQADVDAGQVDNTATADSDQTEPVEDSESVTLAPVPAMTLVKTGTLDDGGDGPDAGDTIDYTFDVTNTGNVTLNNVSVTDPLPGLSAISCPGGNPIPTLAPDATVQCTASYTVTQADVDAGQVDNTATADSDETEPVEDSETVSVSATPVIGVAKDVGSITDQGGGVFDVVLDFVVENLGAVDLTDVQVTDDLDATFPAPATYSVQSGPTATGTLTANAGFDGSGDTNLLTAASSSLAVGSSETISLTVRVTLNGASGPFTNSAVATGDGPGGETASDTSDNGTDPDPNGNDDPGDPGEDDPTVITFTTEPDVSATKTSSLSDDADGSGTLTAGDTLTYSLEISNDDTGDATGVVLTDSPDPATTLVAGSVTTTQGTVTTGNTAGDGSVEVDLGTLAAGGGSATVTFDVVLDDPLPTGVTVIVNQGVVSGGNFATLSTDDPTTAPDDDPTVDEVGAEITDPTEIPTLSEWMLWLLALALAGVAVFRMGTRAV